MPLSAMAAKFRLSFGVESPRRADDDIAFAQIADFIIKQIQIWETMENII